MNEFIHLVNLLKKQDAVKNVIAFTESFVVEKDEINKQFVFKKIFDSNYTDIQKLTQHQILFENYPIYENVLYNKEKKCLYNCHKYSTRFHSKVIPDTEL